MFQFCSIQLMVKNSRYGTPMPRVQDLGPEAYKKFHRVSEKP
jgi:hypothetical protein